MIVMSDFMCIERPYDYDTFDDELNRMLKFHQSSIITVDPTLVDAHFFVQQKESLVDAYGKNFELPGVVVNKIDVSEVDSRILLLFHMLKEWHNEVRVITTYPIMSIVSPGYCSLCPGAYVFDFNENVLLQYRKFDGMLRRKWGKYTYSSVVLSLFLDIEKSLYFYKSSAYLNGVLQVGMLLERIHSLCAKLNFQVKDFFYNTQTFTQEVGVNLRKLLLIHNVGLGELK